MSEAARAVDTVEVTMITDPIDDDESLQVLRRLCGRIWFDGSPIADGTPRGSRATFVLSDADLHAGALEVRIDRLRVYGIGVHRVLGRHPAVQRANQHLGYL